MSDESLIRALRALDRPVDVDPAFDDALFAILEREYAHRRRPRPGLTLLLVAALLVALVVGGAVAVGSGLLRLPVPDSLIIDPDQVEAGDCHLPSAPATTRVSEIATDGPVGSVTFAACSVWVASGPPGVVQRIDPMTHEITATVSVGGPDSRVSDIAADGDEVWATVWVEDGRWKLVQIDPASNSVGREIELPPTMGDHLLVVGGRAWLSGFEFPQPGVIDLETGEVIAHIDGGGFREAFGSVWANPYDGGAMLRINPRTLEVTTIELPHPQANLTAVSDTGLWATAGGGRAYKLSPEGEVLLTIDATSIRAALGGDLYAPTGPREDRTDFILRIDEQTGEVIERLDYPIEGWTEELFAAGGSIWAGNSEIAGLVRYEPGDRP
jgi:streptogramin lyase